MQETLSFQENKLKDIPEINAGLLNSSSDFLRDLNDFNNYYETNFEVQDSARWKQGSYKKFKDFAIHLFNPRLDRAKSIKNIFNHHTYNLNNAKDKLMKLDDTLKGLRLSGINFNDNNDTEGRDRLNNIFSNINNALKHNPDIIVEISKLPWFRRRSSTSFNRQSIPWRPNVNCIFEMEDANPERTKTDLLNKIPDTANPSALYLNIAVPLPDISINITHMKANDQLLYKVDWGSLMVCQTISIFDLVYLNRRIENNSKGRLSLEPCFSGHTYTFPKYSKWAHPFVSGTDNRLVFNTYGTGNTCFGDLTERVLASIALGELGFTKSLLRTWSETYPKHNVGPLNRYYYWTFGKPLNRKKSSEDDMWEAHISRCKDQISNHSDEISKQDFIETFCSNCELTSDCKVYADWTYEPPVLSDDDKAELGIFALDERKKDIRTSHLYEAGKYVEKMHDLYATFNRITDTYNTKRCDVHTMRFFNVEGKGIGYFISREEFNEMLSLFREKSQLSVKEFIDAYYMCESIWYSNMIDSFEIPVDVPSLKEPLENRLKVITDIKSVYIAMQRMQQVPDTDLNSFNSNLY